MKTLTRIFLIVIVFFAINLKETMAVTMSITNASWQSTVDQDNDGYRRSGILRLNVTSDVGVYCTIKIKYTVNNGSVVYLYYQTPGGTLIPAGNSYFDFEIGTSATGGELPHNLYDFIIQIVDWPAGTTVYASRSYSNDSDLNDELFETAAEDQGAQNFNCIPDIEYIQINGTTIPNSSTTNISLNSLNDSFLVRLRGQNIGSDNAPADLSNLTISFQQYTSASDKNLVIVNSSTASDLTVNKLYGAEAQGGDGYADYVIVEANDNNGWNAGESNSMYLDVKAKQWGQFIIEFRMGLPTNNTWVDFVHDPAAGYCPNCYEWDTGIDPIKFISFWIIVNVSQITWPDLVIQNQSVSPSSTNVGATVLSSCTIANIGNGTAGESEVKYYLSSDIYLDDNDHYFSSDFVPQLIAGGSGSMTESLTIPESTVPGSYYILFVADADNEVVESNEDNNVSNAGLVINACNLTVSPTSLSFTSSAGSQNVSVTSNSTWNVTDDASWITVSPTSGSNNGSITVTVTENTGAQRTGTVTVTATCGTVQNITVTQAAPCNLTVSPTSLSFTSSAGSQNVSVTSNSTWNVTDDASWITVSPTSGSNNGSITVSVTSNTGAERTGTITVTTTCGTFQTIAVMQEGISTQNLLYLKRGNPSSWTTPEQPGSQWREIQTWENSGYTVTTIDFLSVTINTSLLSNYSTVRINGNNGDRPITSSEGQALYQWVQSGGNLFAEIPYTNMVPGVSLFGVQTINGQNGGSNGTSWHFNGAPWVIGPVFGPTSTIEEFASECMDKPALTSNHNFEIDATISGYPAIVHKSYGSEYENTKKVIIVFAQGWSHDASYPGNAFRANIYQGDNLAFLSNCIDYFQFAVGNEVIKIDNYPYVRISPNPVNSKAILSLSIQESERVTMEIIDINGNKLWILLNNKQIAVGEHEFEINCEHLATGLYFVKVTTEKFVAVEKLLKH